MDGRGLDVCLASVSAIVRPLTPHCPRYSKFTDLRQESPTGSGRVTDGDIRKRGTLKAEKGEKLSTTCLLLSDYRTPNFQTLETVMQNRAGVNLHV